MDPIARENTELNRLISVEDDELVEELELRWKQGRDQLKIRERRSGALPVEFEFLYRRLEILRRAAHRLKTLAQTDHRQKYGERS